MTAPGWQLRRLPVCASTEIELARWLARREREGRPLPESGTCLAVVSRRQRFGMGQQGRIWHSPVGGLWLSAAFPWPTAVDGSTPLALAAALGLALQLERLGLRPQIKWPNDLLLDGRKLAGVLPRLRWRGGTMRWAQVGVGINGVNQVPDGAVSLAKGLAGHRWHPMATPRRMEPLVLSGVAWAVAGATQVDKVLASVDQRLWQPIGGWPHAGKLWQVRGITAAGGLRLERPGESLTLTSRRSV